MPTYCRKEAFLLFMTSLETPFVHLHLQHLEYFGMLSLQDYFAHLVNRILLNLIFHGTTDIVKVVTNLISTQFHTL